MSVSAGERHRAELAMEGRASDELPDLLTRPWPSVADRIRLARLQADLNDTETARLLGMTVNAYCDLELHNDEAFTVVSIKELVELGRILGVRPRVLLLGREGEGGKQTVAFDDVTARLAKKVLESCLTAEQLGDIIGWDIKMLLRDPTSLWDFSVEALYDICKAVDLDWVAALPDAAK
jgi:transcriptional regulator with XRE-family HTH domain